MHHCGYLIMLMATVASLRRPVHVLTRSSHSTTVLLGASKRKSSAASTSSSNQQVAQRGSISTAEENMLLVSKTVEARSGEIITGLRDKGWAVCDNFLGNDVCELYRKEAAGYLERNQMTLSKSTRWDADTQTVVTYDKKNVFATQLDGGEMYYSSPRLHEYVVSLVKTMVPIVQNEFPEASLSATMASNKLAVCTGKGSYYDKHYDNSGYDDLRKLTVLYYMNHDWRPELGGCFRIYKRSNHDATDGAADAQAPPPSIHGIPGVVIGEDVTYDVEPRGDRLLVFWSDRLVHSVQPSEAPRGVIDHRWALTVWITATHPGAINHNDAEVLQHFSELQKGVQG